MDIVSVNVYKRVNFVYISSINVYNQEWTGFTRAGAQRVIDRFMTLGILVERDPLKTYGKTYEYRTYLSLFQ